MRHPLAFVFLAACGSEPSATPLDSGPTTDAAPDSIAVGCTPGRVEPCPCPGAPAGGAQECLAGGTFGACVCADAGVMDVGVEVGVDVVVPVDAMADAGIDVGADAPAADMIGEPETGFVEPPVCDAGRILCDGACANTNMNCGACGNACPRGLSCVRGRCS